jgi:peptidylprolyl isomerase
MVSLRIPPVLSTLACASFALAVACQPPAADAKPDDKPAEASKDAHKPAEAAKPAEAPPKPDAQPAPDDVAAPPADAEKTASGLASKQLKKGDGSGTKPTEKDSVSVHYTGWTKDGKMFDSSVSRGRPATFALNRVIPGWTEGVQLMEVGEKRRFWIPGNLAYGDVPKRPGAPAGQLTFDVELLSIEKVPEMPEVPKDVAAAPADAKKTDSGLRWRVVKEGSGENPKATSKVKVHYTGWTTDGKMFDSSIPRGQPAIFPLNRVIPGWTEGVQLMKPGETSIFWIPAEMAYGATPKRPGAPAGQLTFQITLLEIMQ